MSRLRTIIVAVALLAATCGQTTTTTTAATTTTATTSGDGGESTETSVPEASQCTKFAVLDGYTGEIGETIDYPGDVSSFPAKPNIDWYSELSHLNLSGHAMDIERARDELEALGFEFEAVSSASARTFAASGVPDELQPGVVLRSTSDEYTLMILSTTFDVDELLAMASTVRSVCEDEWVEAGGKVFLCDPWEEGCDYVGATTVPPTVPPTYEVTTTFGPEVWIDPKNVLIDIPGGRWGDEPMGSTTVEIDEADLPQSIPFEGVTDCDLLTELLGGLPRQAWATARDEVREHDLDHVAVDVGGPADALALAMRSLPDTCPTFEDERGETVVIERLKFDQYTNAMSLTFEDERTAWMATMYRNNVFTWLVVYETGDDPLVESDLDDFARLVQLAFDELAQG